MRTFLKTLLTVVSGLAAMATLLYLGAVSQNWISLVCFVAVAVVYHTWFKQLLLLAWPELSDLDDDDRPIFPG